MPIDPLVKKNWIEVQKRSPHPVNAIGMRIDPKDDFTMKAWRSEGIDQYLKKD